MTRIFFSCDAHGSVPVQRKMTRVHETYHCDVVMMIGDLTGKALVPIVEEKPGVWWSSPYGKKETYKSADTLETAKKAYEKRGFYWFLTTQPELAELQSDSKGVEKLFHDLMLKRMSEWLTLIEETIPESVKVIVSPGNDDHRSIDEVIRKSARVVYPLEKVVDIDERHPMISLEWVNTTPWKNTPRECTEDELMSKLEVEFSRVPEHGNLICNFHAPPYGTRIDLAPELDEKQTARVRWGTPKMVPVGSKSVRAAIEKYQPLLGLHGHIHESPGIEQIGRTLCVNAGSVYIQGMLNAFIVDLPTDSGQKVEVLNVSA